MTYAIILGVIVVSINMLSSFILLLTDWLENVVIPIKKASDANV